MRKVKHSPVQSVRALQAIFHDKLSTYSELAHLGIRGTTLRRMTENGQIISLGNGIYGSTELDPFVAAVLATTKYYPQAVISGSTALQIHGLGDEYIDRIDVDIPRETSVRNQMLRAHRVAKKKIIGVVSLPYHSSKIRIYDLERTLGEAYRLDPAGPLFFKALKRYVALGKIRSEKIKKYDEALGMRVLMHLQQELAGG